MPDRFSAHASSIEAPASHAFAITPDDATDLVEVTRALYVGSAGNLTVTALSGATLTFSNVPAGSIMPLRVSRVRAGGTTAGALIGLV